MKGLRYEIKAEVWLYQGAGSWYFVSVPPAISNEIRELFGSMSRGWGSLPVNATIGKTVWRTSIFPDKKKGTYILPLKAEIRKKEGIEAGDELVLALEIMI
ncbi:DUF1905 domain-containing protein [Candidatus Falkowbacteria bacterium]|nr:DUF1905 domain-containing protein [Candidatus Falkowbacteria bacterium]